MRFLTLTFLLLLGSWMVVAPARGEEETAEVSSKVDAAALMKRVLANRPTKDCSLKGRLFVARDQVIPVEVLIHAGTSETRSIYRSGKTELLVVQPVEGEPHWFLKGKGELTGDQRLDKLAGSQFTFYDLGMPFLHWPVTKYLGDARLRGQDCYMVELSATNQPYGKVKVWVEQKYAALLRVEAFDQKEGLVRRLTINSFKRIGDLWIPKGIDAAFILPGQALPSEEKSRLEIDDGDYETKLPVELFDEAKFGATGK